ncbi:MAG: hypothetical protein RIR11_3289 [Bacteroidota bacterium]|jgi:hypothetical protein
MPDVFLPGNLIRIKDFQFENSTTRDKYMFVLLKNDTVAYVISSLTTSQNKMNVTARKTGCYYDNRVSTYFHFPANELIGSGDFYFDKDTFIFFRENVRKIDIADLLKYADPQDPFAIATIGTLTTEGLKSLLVCVLNSTFTPVGMKAELMEFKDTL